MLQFIVGGAMNSGGFVTNGGIQKIRFVVVVAADVPGTRTLPHAAASASASATCARVIAMLGTRGARQCRSAPCLQSRKDRLYVCHGQDSLAGRQSTLSFDEATPRHATPKPRF